MVKVESVRTKVFHFESYNYSCQTLSRSSEVKDRDPGRGNEEVLLSLITTCSSFQPQQKLPALKQNSELRGAALWSAIQDCTWTGQLPGVRVCAYVFDVWPSLLCEYPPAIPVKENGAVQGSPATTEDTYRADLQHICTLLNRTHSESLIQNNACVTKFRLHQSLYVQ